MPASSDEGRYAIIHMRVPAELKARWVRESRAAGVRLTDWIIDAVDRRIEQDRQTNLTVDAIFEEKI